MKNITSAAKACFKKNSAVLVSEKRKLAVNNKDLVMQLYVAIGELCVALRHELDIDRTIQHASDFPSNFSLPAITAEVYSTDVAATFQDALAACPPRGPPTTDILDCIDRACNLQASVAVEEKKRRDEHVQVGHQSDFPTAHRRMDRRPKESTRGEMCRRVQRQGHCRCRHRGGVHRHE